MKYNLLITKQAMLDEMEAYHYYEDIRPGLGDRFIESVENRYAALSQHPDYTVIPMAIRSLEMWQLMVSLI